MIATDNSANVKKTLTALQSRTSLFKGYMTELLIVSAILSVEKQLNKTMTKTKPTTYGAAYRQSVLILVHLTVSGFLFLA